MMRWVSLGAVVLAAGCSHTTTRPDVSSAPTDMHALDARVAQATGWTKDEWGEAALRLPNGPTYEFFRDLLPPLRYVDADFHCYPIVLSAPSAPVKARLVSNGSCVNALARQATWTNETGIPVHFYAGDKREVFGSDLARLDGPHYVDGYLPIATFTYTTAEGAIFAEEAFASVDPALANRGTVFVKLTLVKSTGVKRGGKPSAAKEGGAATAPVAGVESETNAALNLKTYDEKLEARFETGLVTPVENHRLTSADGKTVYAQLHPLFASFPGRGSVIAPLTQGESCYLEIYTKPAAPADVDPPLTPDRYQSERARCAQTWNDLLRRGTVIETPEKVVNDAWRTTTIGDYELFNRDEIHYSAGNQYDKRYIGEGGDTLRTTALWGHVDDAARLMPAQFEYTRKGLEFHQAAFKLQMLAHYFQLTHDLDVVRKLRPMWEKEIDVILKGRDTPNGMLPREKYCGDIATLVYSLNSNSNCWRGLRDMSVLYADLGETDRAKQLAATAAAYRKIILTALDHAIDRSVTPPFVPIALSGEETPHRPIWASTIGSYWNLMIEYVLGSNVFTPESQTATDVLHYIQANGGMCMGMIRARSESLNFYVSGGRLNDLYGTRYVLTLLRRDEADRALVSFYGKLAQGMTRDTFIGCEGSSLGCVDRFGRQMSLPPNSAANAHFLTMLRYLLVQDWDLNDDGRPETLRLLYATPRPWLADGKTIRITNAPTAFGPVSLTAQSHLSTGQVTITATLPSGPALKQTLLKLRLPPGHHVASARAAGRPLNVRDGEILDLTGLSGPVTIDAKVSR